MGSLILRIGIKSKLFKDYYNITRQDSNGE
jgi:hypothetical protein